MDAELQRLTAQEDTDATLRYDLASLGEVKPAIRNAVLFSIDGNVENMERGVITELGDGRCTVRLESGRVQEALPGATLQLEPVAGTFGYHLSVEPGEPEQDANWPEQGAN
jgi:hypothetical protein